MRFGFEITMYIATRWSRFGTHAGASAQSSPAVGAFFPVPAAASRRHRAERPGLRPARRISV